MVVAFGWYGFVTGAAVVVALGVWWVTASAVTVTVTDDALTVNDAHLDWPYVGLVATLDEDATRLALSREADPRAFVVARTLAARSAVTIEVLDDEDPHPYWLVTTAHPQELANAIVAARDAFRAS